MTEQLIDNAIKAHENGLSFDEFCRNDENIDLCEQLDIAIEYVWEMADYVVNYLKQEWQDEVCE